MKKLRSIGMTIMMVLFCTSFNACSGSDDENGSSNNAAAVDLGLTVKWADHNVGAVNPWDYGDYYAWGETETKSIYRPTTYKYCTAENWHTTGDYFDIGNDISKTQYDVCHVKWGSKWRMPTLGEIKDLINNCDWKWTTMNGIQGYKITGGNNNSIFLPAGNRREGTPNNDSIAAPGADGYYWSSTIYKGTSPSADYLKFNNSTHSYQASSSYHSYHYCRFIGYNIRPVCDY